MPRKAPKKSPHVPSDLIDAGYVRLPGVLSVVPVSETAWYDGIKAGIYPKAVKLGPRTSAWRVADIRALLQSFEDSVR